MLVFTMFCFVSFIMFHYIIRTKHNGSLQMNKHLFIYQINALLLIDFLLLSLKFLQPGGKKHAGTHSGCIKIDTYINIIN